MRIEAELLVTLEALYASVNYLSNELYDINDKIHINEQMIGSNQEEVWLDYAAHEDDFRETIIKVSHAQD